MKAFQAARRYHCFRAAAGRLFTLLLLFVCVNIPVLAAAQQTDNGAYIFAAAGCAGCHTQQKPKGPLLAGGRELVTPFGSFYSPNITPDKETGIGAWTEADFFRAMRAGKSPANVTYFPAFPYGSYTGMSDSDLKSLWGYLQSIPPVKRANRDHDLSFPFNQRSLLSVWRWLYFEEGPYQRTEGKSDTWNRGAYLARVVTHCGECHTPRTFLGGIKPDREFAGNPDGPEGDKIPNITPHETKGIGRWSAAALKEFLADGFMPDGDFVGGSMAEVVENSTGKLSGADLEALIEYIRSVPVHEGP